MTKARGDEINISEGGVLAVNTERFRAVHERLLPLSDAFSVAVVDLTRAKWALLRAEQPVHVDLVSVRLSYLADAVAETCRHLRHMIDVFENVEARLAGKGFTDRVTIDRPLFSSGSDYRDDTRTSAEIADALISEWDADAARGFIESSQPAWLLGAQVGAISTGLVRMYPGVVKEVGLGTVGATTPLKPVKHDTNVNAVASKTPTDPPKNLADATTHFPKRDGAQVSVEKYTMKDGSTQYGVYIAGTDTNPDSPWNMESNTDLYVDQSESASYAAVIEALAQAGVAADDPVHMFTHSQGGMIGGHVAASGDFNVVTHVSFGNPVEVEAPHSVTNLIVRHTNEPVALLAGGGSAVGSGSEHSLTIDRIGDPATESLNPLETHFLDAYRKTATMIDESDDPRLDSMRQLFSELGQAESVEKTDYVATLIKAE